MKIVDSIKNQKWMSDLYCKQLRKSLFLLLIALAVCGCQNDQEPIESPTKMQLNYPDPAIGADSLQSVLEGVSQWHVGIIQRMGFISVDLSYGGTIVCFANGKVSFAVPYTSINFNDNSESTTEYEQHGPYPVSYQSSNTLYIADEFLSVTPLDNGNGYTLLSENIEIRLTKEG